MESEVKTEVATNPSTSAPLPLPYGRVDLSQWKVQERQRAVDKIKSLVASSASPAAVGGSSSANSATLIITSGVYALVAVLLYWRDNLPSFLFTLVAGLYFMRAGYVLLKYAWKVLVVGRFQTNSNDNRTNADHDNPTTTENEINLRKLRQRVKAKRNKKTSLLELIWGGGDEEGDQDGEGEDGKRDLAGMHEGRFEFWLLARSCDDDIDELQSIVYPKQRILLNKPEEEVQEQQTKPKLTTNHDETAQQETKTTPEKSKRTWISRLWFTCKKKAAKKEPEVREEEEEEKENEKQEEEKKIEVPAAAPLIDPVAVCYTFNFNGNVEANCTKLFRHFVDLMVRVASPEKDKIVIVLKSYGGLVAEYGFATSQLLRLRHAGLHVTVCINIAAASGGYWFAAAANTICAAPCASVGSIGVIAEIPNFSKLLKRLDIQYQQYMAGKYKRTVTPFTEIEPEAETHLKDELTNIHNIFKRHIGLYRPQISSLDDVATGEVWLACDAIEKKLIDEVCTSDELLHRLSKTYVVVRVKAKKKPVESSFVSTWLKSKARSWFSRVL